MFGPTRIPTSAAFMVHTLTGRLKKGLGSETGKSASHGQFSAFSRPAVSDRTLHSREPPSFCHVAARKRASLTF